MTGGQPCSRIFSFAMYWCDLTSPYVRCGDGDDFSCKTVLRFPPLRSQFAHVMCAMYLDSPLLDAALPLVYSHMYCEYLTSSGVTDPGKQCRSLIGTRSNTLQNGIACC